MTHSFDFLQELEIALGHVVCSELSLGELPAAEAEALLALVSQRRTASVASIACAADSAVPHLALLQRAAPGQASPVPCGGACDNRNSG